MLTVRKEFEFCAAHSLPGHEKCGYVHGHNYKVVVCFQGLNEDDMVVDFGTIKEQVKPLVDQLDHRNLNDFITHPTAENIAKMIFNSIREHRWSMSPGMAKKLVYVEVWETPTTCARYSE